MKKGSVMVIPKDGKFLGIHRKGNPNALGLIGGTAEIDETPEQTVLREVLEETGLLIKTYKYLFTGVVPPSSPDGHTFETAYFLAQSWEGEHKDSTEGRLEWFTREELEGPRSAFRSTISEVFTFIKTNHPEIKF